MSWLLAGAIVVVLFFLALVILGALIRMVGSVADRIFGKK